MTPSTMRFLAATDLLDSEHWLEFGRVVCIRDELNGVRAPGTMYLADVNRLLAPLWYELEFRSAAE